MKPIAPWMACAIEATVTAASLVRALATAARSRPGQVPGAVAADLRRHARRERVLGHHASWCWIAWNLPIGRPNWSRSLA